MPQFGHTARLQTIAFSPDGKSIATGSADQSIIIWDKSTSDVLRILVHTPRAGRYGFTSIAYSRDGRFLAGVRENEIFLWEVATGKELRVLSGHEKLIKALAFNKDGTLLASGGLDNTIRVWQLSTGKQITCLTGHSSSVCSVAFDDDGKTIRSGSHDHFDLLFAWWTLCYSVSSITLACRVTGSFIRLTDL